VKTKQRLNRHLDVVFKEILPALTNAGIKYWVFGGVGVAGVVGKFTRETQDVDTYVLEKDFRKTELVLKKLVEQHGAYDADGWSLSYSMTKKFKRPKLQIFIKKVQVFEVFPIYKISNGFELRIIGPSGVGTRKLSSQALIQEIKTVNSFNFFSPPREVIRQLLRSYDNPKMANKSSKYLIDIETILEKVI